MRALRRVGLVVGALVLAVGGYALWYVYGAWPVPDGYEFPRHSLWGGGPGALLEGTLVLRDGCIAVGDGTIVWPPGYSLSVEAGQPVVHGSGLDARIGEPFFLTTGFVD